MNANTLGSNVEIHLDASRRRNWSKALHIAPDLYPGIGGKGFRAGLVHRAFAFAGGEGGAPHGIIDAVEILHAGSLVIDDFEDSSLTRRNQPALHRVIGPARAVNAGNWMYFQALELAGQACSDPQRRAELLMKFIQVARQCHEGQAIDLATRVDRVSARQATATALAISRRKTGRLASLAAWCGAHAARGNQATLRAISAFGCRVGVCLQMSNDLEEAAAFAAGAERCDDLLNRRVTWPWAWAAQELSPPDFAKLQRQLAKSSRHPPALAALSRRLVETSLERGVAAINARLDRAVSRLRAEAVVPERVRPLIRLTDSLRSRPRVLVTGAVR